MPRIRTIKPDFPHDQRVSKLSRESRYCLMMLWTLADDAGRLRGDSRLLASLLFPYDDDARELIDGWLSECEEGNCIVKYDVGGESYVQILHWLTYQRIDKPSGSNLPEYDEASRSLAKPREDSSRKGKEGNRKGRERKGTTTARENSRTGGIDDDGEQGEPEVPETYWWDDGACGKAEELVKTVRSSRGYADFAPDAKDVIALILFVEEFLPGPDEFTQTLQAFQDRASTRAKREYANPLAALRNWFTRREAEWRRLKRARELDRGKSASNSPMDQAKQALEAYDNEQRQRNHAATLGSPTEDADGGT